MADHLILGLGSSHLLGDFLELLLVVVVIGWLYIHLLGIDFLIYHLEISNVLDLMNLRHPVQLNRRHVEYLWSPDGVIRLRVVVRVGYSVHGVVLEGYVVFSGIYILLVPCLVQ